LLEDSATHIYRDRGGVFAGGEVEELGKCSAEDFGGGGVSGRDVSGGVERFSGLEICGVEVGAEGMQFRGE
jgi:hypothetical protein